MRHEASLLTLLTRESKPVSGETLAAALGVSRAACWKQIQEYRSRGLEIESSRSGYLLMNWKETLEPERLRSLLSLSFSEGVPELFFYDRVDSTNLEAKRLGEQGAAHFSLVCARSQTAGRGRQGRSWSSAADEGIYATILLRPSLEPQAVMSLTLIAGLAAVRTLAEFLSEPPGLKWPNDVIVAGRKICGILCEAVLEDMSIRHLAVGMGLNVDQADFGPELSDRAISLRQMLGQTVDPNYLLVRLMVNFRRLWDRFESAEGSFEPFVAEYNRLCVNIGRETVVRENGAEYCGLAVQVDRRGDLILRMADGAGMRITAGEAHVRGILAYF